MQNKRRVVVTGLGIVSPVGSELETAWQNILAGHSGIDHISHFDTEGFASTIAGEVRDFDVSKYLRPKDSRKMDPFMHYGIAAGMDALADSGYEITPDNAERLGIYLGSGIGGIHTIQNTTEAYLNKGPRRISPFFVPGSIINMVAGHLSILLGAKGPTFSAVSACTTATHNIGLAARAIAYGEADAMLCGGSEYATTPLSVGGFCSAKALSTRNDEPQKASRPWDTQRDGFVLSDGAGVLMLEEYEQARARGATIYAELTGFGMSSDAFHMTAPPEDGEGAARCMVNAIKDAGIAPEAIDYVNAHGTSTPLGDVAETRAIKRAFGDHAYKLAVSSTKSMTGHMLGAAGGVEAVFSVLALRDQVLPPTINLEQPDEGCDLDYVPNVKREAPLEYAISNSFGFGGTNASLVFKRV